MGLFALMFSSSLLFCEFQPVSAGMVVSFAFDCRTRPFFALLVVLLLNVVFCFRDVSSYSELDVFCCFL